ncbi:hypothetical protein Galf_1504 [Gallionella capsiferriformans ES-2]|uniref:Transmembrane protein n=2 Tax=Gallionella TaxID=96 RepID=D9SG76_GALCS|nr:hypothetical protein Galf_1504 [Gallionella capsiferriformans ES-2]
MNEQNDSHWWEFYGVRYAQGTVVGAMIIFFLFTQNEALKKLLFIPPEPKDFGMPHLILLAVYGLAYCYIASAPILIMHAGRGLMFKSPTNPNPNSGMLSRILWLLIPSFLTTVIYFLNSSSDKTMGSLAVFLFSFLLAFQIQILVSIFKTSWQKTIDYYSAIVKKRKEHEGSSYIESYKHIREHGNSFLIVAFQFFLAIPIFVFVSQPTITSDDSIRHLLIIVLLWVLPAATIWAFGNKLENNLQSM